MDAVFRVLSLGDGAPEIAGSPYGPFVVEHCDSPEQVAARLREQPPDALLLATAEPGALPDWPALAQAVLDTAVVVVLHAPAPRAAVELLQFGVQDVLADATDVPRALRLAIERRRLGLAARKGYSTDLPTGLPNHAQLLEHMTHLLALREREPAPMALIVLRVDGLAAVAETLGQESADVLRRKAAVRLRAALRASDVVASIGHDAFAVLLAWIDSPADGERVMDKLAAILSQPFSVAGRAQRLLPHAGLASYPEHGKSAEPLLRRALGAALQFTPVGRDAAQPADRGPAAAANDEEA
ncbi:MULTISPECIES: GGDEF domain-containing protein [Rubrivivax]|uniref:GGDEF domain-containing protein n=1 Tax=Rubrivivax benzoatilyticus TaxID=316997 RepID=A0ABX0HX83_9BURK|nr:MULTISPECIES: diguanylate cyclase [Rubrivivax]MCD0417641.1 diguanylate cyclase [Rubrivivax sp. JA1024]MCC9598253.1 diguanylate cyclase [Rubrivivax sp. JA1055]MCC9645491.1 diguanylate cyclase [Rubrivivax sp. JA1029]NHK99213.1 GGDEF domain-containing protein [Rubrivivax benzoatilyticus]NHL24924.1 GGDEF domain-containing protein [Rubrivivax benzoatilyticus]